MSSQSQNSLHSLSRHIYCVGEQKLMHTITKQKLMNNISKQGHSSRLKSNPAKLFSCSFPNCGKQFSKKWNLQAHERLHTGSTPFKCRLGCGESYMWMSSRKGHELNRCRFSEKARRRHPVGKSTSSTHRKRASSSERNPKFSEAHAVDSELHDVYFSKIGCELLKIPNVNSENLTSEREELKDISECLSNITGEWPDDVEVEREASSFFEDASPVLADIDLPDSVNFTENFLMWLLPRGSAVVPLRKAD